MRKTVSFLKRKALYILASKKLTSVVLILAQLSSFFSFVFYTEEVSAATNSWTFDNSWNYTYSNAVSFTLSWWIANLNQTTLVHTWVISNATTYNAAYDVVVEWNYAYMTNSLRDSVSIINISNPASPTLVTEIVNNGGSIRLDWAMWIVKSWNLLYVASNVSDALQIIDVTNPAAPTATGQLVDGTNLNGARGIAKVWNFVYVTADVRDALNVINVTNPTTPAISGTIRSTTTLNWARDVKVVWNYAFVAAYDGDRMTVVDISTPASPTVVANINDATNLNGANRIEVSWNYAYVSADLNASVRVIDITNPLAPSAVTNISGWSYSLTNPRDLLVDNNRLFIASFGNDAVNVADISNPASPVYVTKILHNAGNPLLDGAEWLFKVWDFIYTAVFNSDALEILKFNYDNTSPNLQPTTAFNYGSLNEITSFSDVLGGWNQGSITYQISKNNWTTWYYWNGASWQTTVGWVANSTSASTINANLTSFNALVGWTGLFTFKAFFTSNGSQKVELDTVTVNATDPKSPGWVSTNIKLWLKANKWTSTTTDGATLSTWWDQSGNGLDASAVVAPIYRNNTGANLNFNPIIDFDGSTQYMSNLANGADSRSYFAVIIPDDQVDGTLSGQVPFWFDCLSWVLSSGACDISFGGITLWAFTTAINDEVITHAIGSTNNWRSAQTGIASYAANRPMLVMSNENAGANGTDIYEKWIKIDNTTANSYQTLATADYSIGRTLDNVNQFFYDWKVAEIINYSSRISDADRIKIESYLSLKYGMTLKNGTQNYLASDGTTLMWSTSTAGIFINNIFWIGRDDMSELTQIKSKSTNNEGVITANALWEGTNLSPSFVDIADKEFLSISDDNGGNTWTASGSPSWYNMLTRQWRVQETWDVGTISLDFDTANTNFDIPLYLTGSSYYFIYDTDNDNLLSDEIPTVMSNLWGNIWQISWVNLTNGQEFTIASLAWSNNIPTNITLSNSNLNENVANNTTVGTFTTTDADVGDSHTYTFVSGAGDSDNAKFTITGSTLKIVESPDYEIQNSYSIRINTNDGNGWNFQKSFTITINDIGEIITSLLDFENSSTKYTVTSWNWSRLTNTAFEGSYSLESNNGWINNTQSCFQVNHTFSATGTIDFKYNVSSQAWDTLNFYIDNNLQQSWSGSIAWTTYTKTNVLSGFHEYKWCYIKDGAGSAGNDNANIDYITFQNTAGDTTPPTITSLWFASWSLLPGWNHTLIINYNDLQSWINTTTDVITLQKWNGSSWWPDISATWLNLWSKVITATSASYPTNNLGFWKYLYTFQISDNSSNSSSTWAVFYIDIPEITVSTGSFDIGNLSGTGLNFSSDEIIITVKTVGAWFELQLWKNSPFVNDLWDEIIDFDGSKWVWYDKSPYSWTNTHINNNPIIATQSGSINTNWDKNTYTYNVKIGTLLEEYQASWEYDMNLSFHIHLDY